MHNTNLPQPCGAKVEEPTKAEIEMSQGLSDWAAKKAKEFEALYDWAAEKAKEFEKMADWTAGIVGELEQFSISIEDNGDQS